MTEQIKLKPCPFCGENEQRIIELESEVVEWAIYIRCEYCGALGPPADSSQGAKEAWNERVEKKQPNKGGKK